MTDLGLSGDPTKLTPSFRVSGDTAVEGVMRDGRQFSVVELRGHPWHTVVSAPGEPARGRLATDVEIALAKAIIGGRHVDGGRKPSHVGDHVQDPPQRVGPPPGVSEEEWAAVPVERTVSRVRPKPCPFTGRACQHRETCNGPTVIDCWARDAYIRSQPDGPDGLHRDSMG